MDLAGELFSVHQMFIWIIPVRHLIATITIISMIISIILVCCIAFFVLIKLIGRIELSLIKIQLYSETLQLQLQPADQHSGIAALNLLSQLYLHHTILLFFYQLALLINLTLQIEFSLLTLFI